jgi:hypothetical protein
MENFTIITINSTERRFKMKKFLKCFVGLLLFIVLINSSSYAQFYRSTASGNWNANSTWEVSTNGGVIWVPASSTPTSANSTQITINHTVTVTENIAADQLVLSGTISINNGVVLTHPGGATFTLSSGTAITGTGTFQFQTGTNLNVRAGSNFSATLRINSGTIDVRDFSFPYIGRLYGNVIVDAGASLYTGGSIGYTLFVMGNLTVNGSISGFGDLRFYGPSLTNSGNIEPEVFTFDSTSTVAGSGSFLSNQIYLSPNGNITLLSDVTFSPSGTGPFFEIKNGGIFSANNYIFTFNSGRFAVLSGATVVNSGTVRTQNTVTIDPRTGSGFNANVNVFSGTTTVTSTASPFTCSLNGNVVINSGATFYSGHSVAYVVSIYGNLTNNGSMTGIGSSVRFFGAVLANTGSIVSPVFKFDSTCNVSGNGSYTSENIYISSTGNVTLLNNVTFSPTGTGPFFEIKTGGIFSANNYIFTFNSGRFAVLSGATVVNSGTIRTQNTVTIDPRTGSGFNANVNVFSGTTTVTQTVSPFTCRLNGNVVINSGATFYSGHSGAYAVSIYGNLTNNGTMSGAGSSVRFFGAVLANTGSIASPVFNFDSTCTVSGNGSYTSENIYISSTGNVMLLNDVTFSPTGTGPFFEIKTDGIFSANNYIFTFNSGRFAVLSGAIVVNSGTVRTQNTVTIDPRTGSEFNANVNVFSGTTTVTQTASPYTCRLNGNVVINSGATFYSGHSVAYVVSIYGNLTNNGTMTGAGSTVVFFGSAFVNAGLVETPEFKFDSTSTLSGAGYWSTIANILSGAVVTLTSSHQFLSMNINSGGVFITGSNTAKFTASNPIIQNGTLTNAGGKIEYNGTAEQYISAANITYHGLRINNPAGTVLLANVPVNDTLSVIIGDLDLNGNVITVSPIGYLTETPGNTVKGNAGNLVTTRTINAPVSLNVAGFGALLTSTSILGVTEIKRGHGQQSNLSGNTSIQRYYDITPATNSGLNATLVFKYDESELNGKVEPALSLFRSTNTGSSWVARGGTVNTVANNITLSGIDAYSRWSASSPSAFASTVKLIMEGFYNVSSAKLNMRDTAIVYLRNSSSPYALVDSAKSIIDSVTYTGSFLFSNAGTGTYYLQTKHRNSLETWSKTPQSYTLGTGLNYDFTDNITKAFGNNMIQKSSRFCLYSGDVTQDGFIDLSDVLLINNNASVFLTGYVSTDVNGNSIVDLADVLIAYNNSLNFVSVKRP